MCWVAAEEIAGNGRLSGIKECCRGCVMKGKNLVNGALDGDRGRSLGGKARMAKLAATTEGRALLAAWAARRRVGDISEYRPWLGGGGSDAR